MDPGCQIRKPEDAEVNRDHVLATINYHLHKNDIRMNGLPRAGHSVTFDQ